MFRATVADVGDLVSPSTASSTGPRCSLRWYAVAAALRGAAADGNVEGSVDDDEAIIDICDSALTFESR
jgi:hypothetical protein